MTVAGAYQAKSGGRGLDYRWLHEPCHPPQAPVCNCLAALLPECTLSALLTCLQVVVYLPADQFAELDHLGQLSNVYVADGEPAGGGACSPPGAPTQGPWRMCPAQPGLRLRNAACTPRSATTPPTFPHITLPTAVCVGFNHASFTLRQGAGGGGVYVFGMQADNLTVATQGWAGTSRVVIQCSRVSNRRRKGPCLPLRPAVPHSCSCANLRLPCHPCSSCAAAPASTAQPISQRPLLKSHGSLWVQLDWRHCPDGLLRHRRCDHSGHRQRVHQGRLPGNPAAPVPAAAVVCFISV